MTAPDGQHCVVCGGPIDTVDFIVIDDHATHTYRWCQTDPAHNHSADHPDYQQEEWAP